MRSGGQAVTPEAKLAACYALITALLGVVAYFLKRIVDSVGDMAKTVAMLVAKVDGHAESIGELRARSLASEKDRGELAERLAELFGRTIHLEQRTHDLVQVRKQETQR